jgi:glycolate oxidase FAD binding subunit
MGRRRRFDWRYEAVTGTGDVVRGGGRVVKNVAGFDLTRLMVGAWGTLGILTELSVRLRGLPERDLTVAIPMPTVHATLVELLARLRSASIAPIGLELIDGALARRLDAGTDPVVVARLAGNEENVTAQRAALAELGDVADVSDTFWSALRVVEPPSASVVRLSGPVGRLADTWTVAARVASSTAGGFAHATVLRSVARVVVPNEDGTMPPATLERLRSETRAVGIFERLPADLWSSLAPSAATDRLSRGVRKAFDPDRLLNPGILGEATA